MGVTDFFGEITGGGIGVSVVGSLMGANVGTLEGPAVLPAGEVADITDAGLAVIDWS